mmetsp:Transcript_21363/g.49699  ORF Transcript_21363/g.49699 Transcript_21363/m.49699 type:complete len:234 (-) Transcript_21363:1174-1875(-)
MDGDIQISHHRGLILGVREAPGNPQSGSVASCGGLDFGRLAVAVLRLPRLRHVDPDAVEGVRHLHKLLQAAHDRSDQDKHGKDETRRHNNHMSLDEARALQVKHRREQHAIGNRRPYRPDGTGDHHDHLQAAQFQCSPYGAAFERELLPSQGLDGTDVLHRLLEPPDPPVCCRLVLAPPGQTPVEQQDHDHHKGKKVGRPDKACDLHLRDEHPQQHAQEERGDAKARHWLGQV